ncbi:MAG: hypothetical protein KGI06_00520 [Candidatus Micrarchaeota archaeon]|nr:hypothetical protein [Candidatus Micrarchaeota archaeon]
MHKGAHRGHGGFVTCDILRKSTSHMKESISIPLKDEYAIENAPNPISETIKSVKRLNTPHFTDFLDGIRISLSSTEFNKLADYDALQICISSPEGVKSTISNAYYYANKGDVRSSTSWFHTYVHRPILEMVLEDLGSKKRKEDDISIFLNEIKPFLIKEKLLAAVGTGPEIRERTLWNDIRVQFGDHLGLQVIDNIEFLRKAKIIPP